MRRLLFFFLFAVASYNSMAQAPTLQQKLYYTSKVWGFVKYYHSNVSVCGVDWDSVLLHVLPLVRTAATSDEFNDALDTMLAAAGPMAIATSPFPDILPPELKRNRNWSWISTPMLRSDVQTQLDTIKNNFRPHANCWVMDNDYSGSYYGWLVFPYDSLGVNINTTITFPDANTRQLAFFKYWNIIRYFNPYNYILDRSVDSTLYDYVIPMDNAATARELYYTYLRVSTAFNDAHVYGTTYSSAMFDPPGVYTARLLLNYIEGKYLVVKSGIPGIAKGDAVLSVDGLTVAQWEDSLRQFYSCGNQSVFHRTISSRLFGRMAAGVLENITVEDSAGVPNTFTTTSVAPGSNPSFFYGYFYPNDSITSVLWETMPCDIGYVNMGNLESPDVPAMYDDLRGKSAIIFDIRNYPNGTAWDIAQLMYPSPRPFAKDMIPDVTYPGTYFWDYDSLGVFGNPTPYTGKIIILTNQETQSQAEYSCMILGAMPNVVKIGSQTAGADGNVTFWKATQDLHVGFTTLGIFYPNGDSTQRIGIVPDSVVTPTRTAIRHSRDELLEKALTVAGCNLSVPLQASLPSVYIHPNPASDIVTIDMKSVPASTINIALTDVTGKTLQQSDITGKTTHSFNIASLAPSMYFIKVSADGNTTTYKFIKQ